MIIMSVVLYLGMGVWFREKNRKRAAGKEDDLVEGMSAEEAAKLGDKNPEYRYSY